MSRNNWEPEDGMGFAGMVPTLAEKREEAERERASKKFQDLQAANFRLHDRNRELTRQVEQLQELVQAASALVMPPLRYNDCTIEIDCSDHSTAMQIVRRLRKAIEAALTAPASSSDPGRADTEREETMRPNEYPLYLQNVDEKP